MFSFDDVIMMRRLHRNSRPPGHSRRFESRCTVQWRACSLFNKLLMKTSTETSTVPLWVESTGDRWIALTMGQLCDKSIHAMSQPWCHRFIPSHKLNCVRRSNLRCIIYRQGVFTWELFCLALVYHQFKLHITLLKPTANNIKTMLYWPFKRGKHWLRGDSPDKGPVMHQSFLCHEVISLHLTVVWAPLSSVVDVARQ